MGFDGLAYDAGYGVFPFHELNDAIDAGEGNLFAETAGPEDFELVHSGSGAEAEVEAGVRRRGVAGATEDVGALADAAGGEEDFCADSVSGGFVSVCFRGGSPISIVAVYAGAETPASY